MSPPGDPPARIGIVNTGGGALRLLHVLRDYRADEHRSLVAIALATADESGNLWVREADEAIVLPRAGSGFERVLDAAAIDALWSLGAPAGAGTNPARYTQSRRIPWIGWPHDPAGPAVTGSVGGGELFSVQAVAGPDSVSVAGACEVGLIGESITLDDVRREALASAIAELRKDGQGRVAGAHLVAVLAGDGDSGLEVEAQPGLIEGDPVVEMTTGLDLLKAQLDLAFGGDATNESVVPRGAAATVSLAAVMADPQCWAGGRIALLRLPGGPGIRVDPCVAEGDLVTPAQPRIARLTAWGRTREEARRRLRRALDETVAVVEGNGTNRGALLEALGAAAPAQATTSLGVAVAAIDAYERDLQAAEAHFLAWARRGRPQASAQRARRIQLRDGAARYVLDVARIGPARYRVRHGDDQVDIDLHRLGPYESRVVVSGQRLGVISSVSGAVHQVEVEGVSSCFVRDDGEAVCAPLPGVVVSVLVHPGDEVNAGDPIAVVETMKLETLVRSSRAGRVRRVLVGANVQVAADTALVLLEGPAGGPAGGGSRQAGIRLPKVARTENRAIAGRCDHNLLVLSNLVLGYDVEPADAHRAEEDQADVWLALGPAPNILRREIALLNLFADLRVLFRSQHEPAEGDFLLRSPEEHFFAYLRSLDPEREGLPDHFVADLRNALAHYGQRSLQPGAGLHDALYWIFQSQLRAGAQVPIVIGILERWMHTDSPLPEVTHEELAGCLDHLIAATARRFPVIADLARDVRFRRFDAPLLDKSRAVEYRMMDEHLEALVACDDGQEATPRDDHIEALVSCPLPLAPTLLTRHASASDRERAVIVEIMTRRYYRMREVADLEPLTDPARWPVWRATYRASGGDRASLFVTSGPLDDLAGLLSWAGDFASREPPGPPVVLDVYAWDSGPHLEESDLARLAGAALDSVPLPQAIQRVTIVLGGHLGSQQMSSIQQVTYRRVGGGFAEDQFLRGLHPMMAARLRLSRLQDFELRRIPSGDDVYVFHARARENPDDERLFALAEVRDLTPTRDAAGRVVALPQLERMLLDALAAIRHFQAPRPNERRLQWNRVVLHLWPPLLLDFEDIERVARRMAPATEGLGLERIVVRCRRPDPTTGELRDRVLRLANPTGAGFVLTESDPPTEPIRPLDEYTRKVVQCRRRGLTYPYEIIEMVTARRAGGRPEVTGGEFTEYDLDGDHLVPAARPFGRNQAGIVTGLITNHTATYPDGIVRVTLLGDPTRALGSLAEPECRRVIAAIDLAERLAVPVDWFAVSAGAKIAMDSGTESMDWIAAVLRRLIEFTQAGGEVNVVVTGINVGAQPYWNAEATMLMHTRGILIMTPASAMVLTGKQALDYSGGVSAEDNFGIGGYERIMGPNGQAQYWAEDIGQAIGILLAHHAHTYVAPGERFPRRAATADPLDRDVRPYPHRLDGSPFRTVGDVFSEQVNPGRNLAFDIRTVMAAVADQDHPPLERWPALADGETAVVWDAHLGGFPVALLGIESRPLLRRGRVPADGPDTWSSGTLFPMSSKKIARAVNSASGNRPLVVLANLSGFDGSPDSMRSLQLEYGAEIGRAVVNFRGPIVFCVISRYHGGAFVVFSQRLNENLETIAVEGARASVIGGAPAAAVVFANEVSARVRQDFRVAELEQQAGKAEVGEQARLRAQLAATTADVRAEKLREVATEFDQVHTVERALQVGSVRRIISACQLRPALIDAVARGIERELA